MDSKCEHATTVPHRPQPCDVRWEGVPDRFHHRLSVWWSWFDDACQQKGVLLACPEKWQPSASRVWLASEFVRQLCLEKPALLASLVDSGDLFCSCSKSYFYYQYRQILKCATSVSQLKAQARLFRCQMMMRFIWRDVSGWADLYETIKETSLCAEAIIDLTSKWLFRWHSRRTGITPVYQGRPSYLMVLAVGKLGGMELNLSSDVDLIFCYMSPEGDNDGEKTRGFYQSLARQLVALLHDHGLLYRVDLRLRPFGTSGSLVVASSQLLRYYQDHAREWERYAMLKARIISGDPRAASELQCLVESFVYRPYLDYATVESLRNLHVLWRKEAKRRNMQRNIKMGVGGIREIEFIVQNIQLTRGGQEPRLRRSNLLSALAVIEQERLLPSETVRELEQAYIFFRRLENRLQACDDAQTHDLPHDCSKRDRLAVTLAYDGWDGLAHDIEAMRSMTHNNFKRLVFRPELYEYTSEDQKFIRALERSWSGQMQCADLSSYVKSLGFAAPDEMVDWLVQTRRSKAFSFLGDEGRGYFNQLILLTLIKLSQFDRSCDALRHVLPILTVVIERKAYLVLLIEHPKAHEKLLRLSHANVWLSEQIISYPVLLGELIDENRLYEPMSISSLKRKLLTWLQATTDVSEQEQMRVVQHFKQLHVFRVAVMDTMGKLPIAQVSNYLTYIAEAILQHVHRLAWRSLVTAYGRPSSARRSPKCLVIAYGKLGGFELGYGSDLDLVFLYHKSDGVEVPGTDGKESVSEITFYTRLAQKILQLMGSQTLFGPLYTVDTRLRPMGDSGLLLSSLEAFYSYQKDQAWVWEHQALVRARVVVGPPMLRERFYAMRRAVLSMHRERSVLWQSVCDMRRKMHAAAKAVPGHVVHLKDSRGCINDVEFLVQYHVLAFAEEHSALMTYTDNIRLLDVIGRLDLLSAAEVKLLQGAFLTYRSMLHKLDMQKLSGHTVPVTKLHAYRSAVTGLWQSLSVGHTNG